MDENLITMLRQFKLTKETGNVLDQQSGVKISSKDYDDHEEYINEIMNRSRKEINELNKKIICCDTSISERNLTYNILLNLIKKLIIFFQEVEYYNNSIRNNSILTELLQILCHNSIPLDLRNSCGLLVIRVYLNGENNSTVKALQEVQNGEEPFNYQEELSQLAIFHGILCCTHVNKLFEPSLDNENNDIGSNILNKIILLSKSNNGNIVTLCSRLLHHIMLRLSEYILDKNDKVLSSYLVEKYSIQSELSLKILDMIWLLWDHYLDSAKHLARETFILFINLHKYLNHDEALIYFISLSYSLLNDLPNKKSAFSILSLIVPFIGATTLLSKNSNLPLKLVKLLDDPTYSMHSAGLLENLFKVHKKEIDIIDWKNLWYPVIFNNFSKEMLTYGFESLLEKLLLSSGGINSLSELIDSNKMKPSYLCLILMCAKITLKNRNIIIEKSESEDIWKNIIPFNIIKISLYNSDPSVRALAFNLLNDNSKSTELYDENELKVILSYIENNISSQDAAFRQKFINSIKKLLNRINKGMAVIKRKQGKNEQIKDAEIILQYHEDFICNLFKFLVSNLYFGANFPRRYSSLLILEHIASILFNPPGVYSHLFNKLYNLHYIHTLILCLCDSYENVKQISVRLIKKLTDVSKIKYGFAGKKLFDTSCNLARSSRPLDSLTASYIVNSILNSTDAKYILEDSIDCSLSENLSLNLLWHIFKKLSEEVRVAEESLLNAAVLGPMYGQILALRSILGEVYMIHFKENITLWQELLAEIIETCIHISLLVSPVVKNSSPEGNIPNEFFENYEDAKMILSNVIIAKEIGLKNNISSNMSQLEFNKAKEVSAQTILLCGWRSIKEISLLFSFLIKTFGADTKSNQILKYEDIKKIGNFYIDMLLEMKHRGAFEQTYAGFLIVCQTLWQNNDPELSCLPEKWLRYTLDTVGDTEDNRLCATRRSAGVPFIIQAILSSEPEVRDSLSLKETFKLLLKLGSSEVNLEPKLHAFNILRALYKDTRLGESIMPYIEEGVQIAISGYKHQAWNVRNSATLLFSSLVTRMLGVKRSQNDLHSKNSISALIFFKQFPRLYDFFIEDLKQSIEEMKSGHLALSAYPILLILARFAPSSSEGHSTAVPLGPFISLVLYFNCCPIYHLRDLASKALMPLLTPPILVSTVKELCQNIYSKNQNQIHGSLLCLIEIFKRYSIALMSEDKVIKDLTSILWLTKDINCCLFTRAFALKLFSEQTVFDLISSTTTLQHLSVSCFSLILTSNIHLRHQPGFTLVVEEATKLYLKINDFQIDFILKIMECASCNVRLQILQHYESKTNIRKIFFENILNSSLNDDSDIECKKLKLNICYKYLNNLEILSFKLLNLERIFEFLNEILQTLICEYREDYLGCLIQTSGVIAKLILQTNCYKANDGCITEWAENVTSLSDVQNSSIVRAKATEALCSVIAIWNNEYSDMENVELCLLKALLELSTDDDEKLRDIVNDGIQLYIKNFQLDQTNDDFSTSLYVSLSNFYSFLANKSIDHLSLLIQHSLREDQIEEFGLTQVKEDDRVFEKGETKVYREDMQISKDVSKAIREALANDINRVDCFNIGMISEYLLLPISHKNFQLSHIDSQTDSIYSSNILEPNSQYCDTKTFMAVLKREIEYILDQCSIFKEKDVFALKHFDVWISRLGCRAMIWSSLKELSRTFNVEIDQEFLDNIRNSLLKPQLFVDILHWLSL